MITLAIDAATYVGTVAVLDDNRIAAQSETAMRDRQAERLMPLVDTTLREAGVELDAVERIVCGAGPGSFTSLRIAASIAKGLAVARQLPLVAVSSLALLAASVRRPPGRYLATMDALRGEAYAAPFEVLDDEQVQEVPGTSTDRIPVPVLADRAAAGGFMLIGAFGAAGDGRAPHARGALRLARAIAAAQPVDPASWEPLYGRLAEAQVRWEAQHGPLRARH